MASQNAIKIERLSKTFDPNIQALSDVSFSIKKGEFFGLLGPNGAGKSTTISILSSLIRKTSGHVSIYGYNIETHHIEAKTKLGIVPQEFNFNIFETPLQIIVNQGGYYGVRQPVAQERAEKLLKDLGIWEKRHMPSISMSGGQKRRLMIARALVHDPKILILDEPTAGVDVSLRHTMWKLLKDLNKAGLTIILTTHYLEEAEMLCKRIGIIDKGHLIALDDTSKLLKQLHTETVILYCKPFEKLPELKAYKLKSDQNGVIEAQLKDKDSVAGLLDALKEKGIEVKRFKNKMNRLEELFMDLVENS